MDEPDVAEDDDLPDFGPDIPIIDAESRSAYIENLLVVAGPCCSTSTPPR
jgi:hypothetical protein